MFIGQTYLTSILN